MQLVNAFPSLSPLTEKCMKLELEVPLVRTASLQKRHCNNLQLYADYHAFYKHTLLCEAFMMLKFFLGSLGGINSPADLRVTAEGKALSGRDAMFGSQSYRKEQIYVLTLRVREKNIYVNKFVLLHGRKYYRYS